MAKHNGASSEDEETGLYKMIYVSIRVGGWRYLKSERFDSKLFLRNGDGVGGCGALLTRSSTTPETHWLTGSVLYFWQTITQKAGRVCIALWAAAELKPRL